MEDVLIECSPGISGDMLLGAFYDLGVPKQVIEQPLIDLGLKDFYHLEFNESKSSSIRFKKEEPTKQKSSTHRLLSSLKWSHLNVYKQMRLFLVFVKHCAATYHA